MHVVIYLSSEVKPSYFVSIKLFRNWFVQFTVLWFHSSLKQAVQPELSLFHVQQSSQLFFLISTGTGSKCDQSPQSDYISFSFGRNNNLYCYWIHYRLFLYTHSNTFSGFESTTVRAIRKYKFKKMLVWTSYFDVLDITTSSGK